MMETPILTSKRLILKFLEADESKLAVNYFTKNKEHLRYTMPDYSNDLLENEYWLKESKERVLEFNNETSCKFFVYSKDSNIIIGTVNFTDFLRWVFQGCFLGYRIDKERQGQGLMTEALVTGLDYIFDSLNFHKVLANYMPSNPTSGKVLEKLGFEKVGLARAELFMNGDWQDHIETRKINPNWKNTFNH